jgi:predicted GIY-YIG superfamily endonuclease
MIYLDGPQDAFYIYIILCKDGSFYVGLTNDLMKRFEEHQTGVYPTCYTYKRRPLELKYYEMIPYLQDAIQRELQLKRWSRAKKQALVDRHYHKLQLLSQCQNFTHHKYKEMHPSASARRELRKDNLNDF